MGERNATGARIAETDRRAAREIDPSSYLRSLGYEVCGDRHLSVTLNGDEVYRITRKDDGHYVTCDHYQNPVGDNIDLVRELDPGTSFVEAVFRLHGAPTLGPCAPVLARTPPTLPPQSDHDKKAGREYLKGRGIDTATIEKAEKSGMVRYTSDAVLFVGYDEHGTAQNVTRRATRSDDPLQKRDIKGSDKRFPQVLQGTNPKVVWVVEGGIDALAAQMLVMRSGVKETPTVIVSGGAGCRSWINSPHIRPLLESADSVIILGENEKNAEVQARTDAEHEKQRAQIEALTLAGVECWKLEPQQGKDLAEYNMKLVEADRRKDMERRQTRDQYNSWGNGPSGP